MFLHRSLGNENVESSSSRISSYIPPNKDRVPVFTSFIYEFDFNDDIARSSVLYSLNHILRRSNDLGNIFPIGDILPKCNQMMIKLCDEYYFFFGISFSILRIFTIFLLIFFLLVSDFAIS